MAAKEYRRLIFIVWICVVAAIMAIWAPRAWQGVNADTDDFMRLVQVEDLLAGQSWNDLTQYRLDPPGGTLMHWSRLPDAPLALVTLALSPLMTQREALTIASIILPPVYFLFFLLPFAVAGRLLLGNARSPVGLLVAICGSISIAQFVAGRVDHHGLQLVMLMTAISLLLLGVARARWRSAIIWAGVPFGLSIWIGMEVLPLVAAWFAALGIVWCRRGDDLAKEGALAALLAGAIGLAALLTSTPPTSWLVPYCDALSPMPIIAMALVSAGFAIMHLAGNRTHGIGARLAVAALCGGAVAVFFALSFPACLSGDRLALDPLVEQLWLRNVSEAIPVQAQFAAEPLKAIAKLWAAVLGLGYCAWRIARTRGRARDLWGALAIILLCPTLLTFWQVRATNFSQLVALLPLAGLAADLWRVVRGRGPSWRQLAALVPVLFVCSVGFWPTVSLGYESIATALRASNATTEPKSTPACRNSAPIPALSGQKPTRILNYIDIGPMLLFSTPHAVLAAPYHRDNVGLRATIEMFRSSDDEAIRKRLRELEIGWIVTCPGVEEKVTYRTDAGDGLAERLAADRIPDYLEPVRDPSQPELRFFRVRLP